MKIEEAIELCQEIQNTAQDILDERDNLPSYGTSFLSDVADTAADMQIRFEESDFDEITERQERTLKNWLAGIVKWEAR